MSASNKIFISLDANGFVYDREFDGKKRHSPSVPCFVHSDGQRKICRQTRYNFYSDYDAKAIKEEPIGAQPITDPKAKSSPPIDPKTEPFPDF